MGHCLEYLYPELFILQFKSCELHLNHEGIDKVQELIFFQAIYKTVSWKAVIYEKPWEEHSVFGYEHFTFSTEG